MGSFRVSSESLGQTLVLSVYGDLDAATAPELTTILEAATAGPTTTIVIDLTGCTFLDSRGSRSLGLAARDTDGVDLSLVCPPTNRPVMLVLELVGLVGLLRISETLAGHFEHSP